MAERFTKGTWQRSGVRSKHTDIYGHLVGPDNNAVVVVPYDPEHHAECLANANLIAAAPDLYEALKGCLEFVNNGFELGFIENDDFDTVGKRKAIIEAALSKAHPTQGDE